MIGQIKCLDFSRDFSLMDSRLTVLTVLAVETALLGKRREISIKPVLDATAAFDQETPIHYPLSVSDQSHLLYEHLSRTVFQGT